MADRWKVVSQRQTSQLKPGGGFRDVMEVTFEVIATGTTGTVDIPLNAYNADTVRDAIESYVDRIEEVHNL